MESLKRCQNFSMAEIDILVSLIEKFKSIVECKKTDSVNNLAKEKAWKEIELQFNSLSATGRNSKMLRSKWESLKKTTKKEYAVIRCGMYKTGGGPEEGPTLTGVKSRILSLIGVGATGFPPSQFDSDRLDLEKENSDPAVTPISPDVEFEIIKSVVEDADQVHNVPEYESNLKEVTSQPASPYQVKSVFEPACSNRNLATVNEKAWLAELTNFKANQLSQQPSTSKEPMKNEEWSSWNPSQLKTPKHKLLVQTRETPGAAKKRKWSDIKTKTHFEELAKKKIEWIDFQMTILKEESIMKKEMHDLEMKQKTERHELELKILNEKHILEMKMLEQNKSC